MASEASGPTIFLSYAHADAKRAQALANALTARGYIVWWDAMIEGGALFARSIRQALESADAVVVLWSKTSIDSDWVADEAGQGRDRRRLVPVSLDGSLPPLGFRQYQSIDLSGRSVKPSAAQVERIDRAIAVALGSESGKTRSQPLSQGPSVDRRRALLVAGGAGILIVGGGTIFAMRDDLFGPGAAERSIAVLPFKNLSGDPAQAYLSDGLTDEVRSALTRNAGLRVLAATSTNAAQEEAGGAKAIAGKLGVAHLLSGSIQRAGDVARVSIELTDGKTGFSTWSKRIDARLTDIFAFQTEVARTVSEALSVRMAVQDPAPGGTRNVAAYEAYLRGKALFNLSKDEATDREATALFQNAIVADPGFARARAGLSRSLASFASRHASVAEIGPTFDAAINEAQAAVDLAPKLAEAHLALGFSKYAGNYDIEGARAAFEKAYEYGRGNADTLLVYAIYAVRARRPKAAHAAIARALALDPLNPRTHRAAGAIDFAVRDYDNAARNYRNALKLNPGLSTVKAFLGLSLVQKGQLAEARTAIMAEKSKMFHLTALAILERRAGNQVAADRAYASLVSEVGDSSLYQQAQVMAQFGRTDQALALLARAKAVGDPGMTALASDPLLDPIAKDARFRAFAKATGFA